MIYVSDRKAPSICDTALEFLIMKSSYWPSHFAGNDSAWTVEAEAWRYISIAIRIAPTAARSDGGVGRVNVTSKEREWRRAEEVG
jgi:hypothetical protein